MGRMLGLLPPDTPIEHILEVKEQPSDMPTREAAAVLSLFKSAQAQVNEHLTRLNGSQNRSVPQTPEEMFEGIRGLIPTHPLLCRFCQLCIDSGAENLLQIVGRIAFLADAAPEQLLKGVDCEDLQGSVQRIEQLTMAELHQIAEGMERYAQIHREAGLQDAGLALSFYKPKQIARALLTSQGKLNPGLIADIRTHLIAPHAPLLEYEKGILRVLEQLDFSWQKEFDAVCLPLGEISAEMVRSEMGLHRSEKIEQRHCQCAMLAALLSQQCQGPVGNCFAVAWAIKKHNEYLRAACKDYRDLIQFGCLQRIVSGKRDAFFFLDIMADPDLQKRLTIDRRGNVLGTPLMLWQIPSLVSACRQMGIDAMEAHWPRASQELFHGAGQVQISAQEVIEAFCATEYPLAKGKYGFSHTNNRLLRACENALAAMAEARPGDAIRDRVNQVVARVLQPNWEMCQADGPIVHKAKIEQLRQQFVQQLNGTYRFLYNPAILRKKQARDGSSTVGGFELYRRDLQDETRVGTRIQTPEQFGRLISDALHPVLERAEDLQGCIQHHVLQHVESSQFLANVLHDYDPENARVVDPVSHYEALEQTPMTTCSGDNPWEVVAIDTGTSFIPNVRQVRPKSSYDLLKWVLELASWKEQTMHYLEAQTGSLAPATSPTHAFNLALAAKEIVAFVHSGKTSDAWICDTLLEPGHRVAQTPLPPQIAEAFVGRCFAWLAAQFPRGLPALLSSHYHDLAHHLLSTSHSIHGFIDLFFSGFKQMFRLNARQSYLLSLIVDDLFSRSLVGEVRESFLQLATRFAKTNWNAGDKNIYFCAYFNLRTLELSFGEISEDKALFRPMDEEDWVVRQEWAADPVDWHAVLSQSTAGEAEPVCLQAQTEGDAS